MAINLLRHNPKQFSRSVDTAFRQMEELSNPETKKGILELLKHTEPMGLLKFDESANQACRFTNDAAISNEELEPVAGGVLVRYQEIIGEGINSKAAEDTIMKYEGIGAEPLLVLQLAKFVESP